MWVKKTMTFFTAGLILMNFIGRGKVETHVKEEEVNANEEEVNVNVNEEGVYLGILTLYKEAIMNQWNPESIQENDLWPSTADWLFDGNLENWDYYMYDVDGNGVKELMIYTKWAANNIVAMYTI